RGMGISSGARITVRHVSPAAEIRLVVHGDDLTALGWNAELDWYREVLTNKFEAKVKGRIGPRKQDDKSMRVLNRTIQWTEKGIEYESDQRHAEIIVAEFGWGTGSKSVVTPGVPMNNRGNS
ncbi:MAG: hypothetical protein ACKPKO_61305, partial [Candidatus Fonsibacter sp.]